MKKGGSRGVGPPFGLFLAAGFAGGGGVVVIVVGRVVGSAAGRRVVANGQVVVVGPGRSLAPLRGTDLFGVDLEEAGLGGAFGKGHGLREEGVGIIVVEGAGRSRALRLDRKRAKTRGVSLAKRSLSRRRRRRLGGSAVGAGIFVAGLPTIFAVTVRDGFDGSAVGIGAAKGVSLRQA